MPLLARGNFNPEFISVLSHKQNDDKSQKSKLLIKEKWTDTLIIGIDYIG